MAGGGKGTSKGSGPHTGHGRYGGWSGSQKGLNGGGNYNDDVPLEKPVSREERVALMVTPGYKKMRDREEILKSLYNGELSGNVIVQILLDIRDILSGN